MKLRIVPVEDQFAGFLKSPKGGVIGTAVGPTGPPGDQGEQGEPGTDGTDGTPGAPGPANSLAIGTVTGGATASAAITGEAPSQELSLVLPKGNTGDKGDKGDTGLTGPAGGVNSVNTRTGDVTITKSDVGLSNADNTSDASKPVSTATQTALNAKEAAANKGAANGYAPLGSDSLVPSAYLPSYVDDVLEYVNLAGFPGTGTSGKIYTAIDTGKIYRWSGSTYIEISPSPGSTDSVTEGSTNKYYTDTRADARVVAGITGKADKTTTVSAGTGLTGGGDLSANRSLAVTYGTAAGTAAQGNDSRLSDTRTPTDNTVTTAKIQDDAVTSAKIANGAIVNADINAAAAIALSKLAITGTPDGTKVLGDSGAWVAAAGASANAGAYVAAGENTTSATYTKLATTTDKVTVNIGASKCALVFISAYLNSANVNPSTIYVGFACSGANTLAAADIRAVPVLNTIGAAITQGWFMLSPEFLTATGSTTFDLQYRVTGGTMGAIKRTLIVIPL